MLKLASNRVGALSAAKVVGNILLIGCYQAGRAGSSSLEGVIRRVSLSQDILLLHAFRFRRYKEGGSVALQCDILLLHAL